MVRTKVFVGNLAFKTKEADLAQEFKPFNFVSANIITRRSRSLGYGFVELETLEDAQKAAAQMNKKNIDGREINVELAKPREETPSGEQAAAGGAAPAAQRPRRQRKPRDPTQAPAQAPANNNAGAAAPANNNAQQGDKQPRRRFRRRAPRDQSQAQPTQNGAAPAAPQQPRQPRQPREPRAPRPPRAPRAQADGQAPAEQKPRNPSKTTLFVANLPFSVDDAGLKQIFEGFPVKSAHVVIKRNGRSKGFGFVELENEDAQVKARDAIDQKVVSERPLIVKIALTEDIAAAATGAAPAPAK